MSAYESLEDHQLVLEVFGGWPSFHDGEVHRVVMDRSPGPRSRCFGLCGQFTAVRGRVLAVHPCNERGERFSAVG